MSEEEAARHIKSSSMGHKQSSWVDQSNGERFRSWLEKETGKNWSWIRKEFNELRFKSDDGEVATVTFRRVARYLLAMEGVEHYWRKRDRADWSYYYCLNDNKMLCVSTKTVKEKGKLVVAGRYDRPENEDPPAPGEGAYRVPLDLHTEQYVDLSEYGPGSQMRMF
jgi:hypothetical protein